MGSYKSEIASLKQKHQQAESEIATLHEKMEAKGADLVCVACANY